MILEDARVRFRVRVAAGLERKRTARRAQDRECANPFRPYDEELFVAGVSPTHVALLNRFPVFEHHLLLVTRAFAEQEARLEAADFDALARCLAEVDGLGFYNSGRVAGASQRHRHLQLVPLPLGDGPERTPVDPLLTQMSTTHGLGRCPTLPFAHAIVSLPGSWSAGEGAATAASLRGGYDRALDALGMNESLRPYNLLVTREWMLVVPRCCEHAGSISVNALGFAGSFFVRDAEALEELRAMGAMNALRSVAEPG